LSDDVDFVSETDDDAEDVDIRRTWALVEQEQRSPLILDGDPLSRFAFDETFIGKDGCLDDMLNMLSLDELKVCSIVCGLDATTR
jgi:hypothetical protein